MGLYRLRGSPATVYRGRRLCGLVPAGRGSRQIHRDSGEWRKPQLSEDFLSNQTKCSKALSCTGAPSLVTADHDSLMVHLLNSCCIWGHITADQNISRMLTKSTSHIPSRVHTNYSSSQYNRYDWNNVPYFNNIYMPGILYYVHIPSRPASPSNSVMMILLTLIGTGILYNTYVT